MNNTKWIDTHAHYDSKKFKDQKILTSLEENVIHIVNLGTNMNSNKTTLDLINKYSYIWGMIGFFPTDTYLLETELCSNAEENLKVYLKQLEHEKILGIGEIGLDYHWNCVGPIGQQTKGEQAREIQKKWLKYQIDLSIEKKLPISLHSRDAEDDTATILNNYSSLAGVVHCFSYGIKSADLYLNKGLYLGIGGTSTYKSNKELLEVIKMCPIERILLETDAPYLSPEPVRREINNSSYIKYVIDNICNIKGLTREDVISKTNDNAYKLLKFKRNRK